MDRLKELIGTLIILLIIISISSKVYKGFKRSDFYKGTDTYKKELKSKKERKKNFLKKYKEVQENK